MCGAPSFGNQAGELIFRQPRVKIREELSRTGNVPVQHTGITAGELSIVADAAERQISTLPLREGVEEAVGHEQKRCG